nr:putative ribonuclease H-like domain-containing protein [Tanacetum cinerariifolium]
TAAKVSVVSAVKGKKEKWVWRPKCPILDHDSRTSELNGGYVAFGGNPKGGKISGKGKIKTDFKLPDESQVLLRVPRENNMYDVNLKDIVPSRDLTYLFTKATIDESNLWHRRLGHINFKTINKLVKGTGPTWLFDIDSVTKTMNYQPVTTGNQTNPSVGFQDTFDADKAGKEANLQYVLFPVWSTSSLNPQNKEGDIAFAEKEHDAEKPEFVVNLSPSKINAAGHNYSNSTNPISAAGPSNSNSSLTHGQSSLRDTYQPTDMVEREDIVYSDHENVGAEADFNNLKTSITVSPIPTTRIHNAHPISQIIGNLSLTSQTRSMARITRDQGGILQILNEDFYTCMFGCFLSQEKPKRIHQALKDPSWIEAIQEELISSKCKNQSTNPQLDNEDLKQIDVDDIKEMGLRWQMAMLTMRASRFLQKTGRILEEEPANFALMGIPSSSSSDNEENIIMLKNEVEARDNFILTLKQKLKQAETEKDDLKLKFEKFQSSSKSLTELIAIQTNNKHDLGYLSSEDDSESMSLTCPSDRLSPSGGYHVVPPPITWNFMPPKPDLVFNTAPLDVESDHSTFNVQVSPAKPAQAMSHTTESMAPIIED